MKTSILRFMALASLFGATPTEALPKKDCASCDHNKIKRPEDGHCYMFKEDFPGDRCGQYVKGKYV
jgi:hypothetical protein